MHDPSHRAGHEHRHAHDRGALAVLGYLRHLPVLWRSEVSAEVVRAIAPRAGERVVDLGAGMGAATFEAARTGASVVAVDPAPFMRATLRLRCRWPGRAAVAVLAGAAESIPAADASIDALWTVNTIHHWTDPERASRELARVVRGGGRVLLMDEDLGDPEHPWHDRVKGWHSFPEVDVDALADALRKAGFASAKGSRTRFAGRPAKAVRAER